MRCQEHNCDEELCWHIHGGEFSLGPFLGMELTMPAEKVTAQFVERLERLKRCQQALAKLIAAADGLRADAQKWDEKIWDEFVGGNYHPDGALTAYDTARAEWEKIK